MRVLWKVKLKDLVVGKERVEAGFKSRRLDAVIMNDVL